MANMASNSSGAFAIFVVHRPCFCVMQLLKITADFPILGSDNINSK